MGNRLLVLSASIGAGHVKAGEALCQTYAEQFGGEAFHLDFFRYSTPTFSRWIEQAYYLVTKHTPAVYKFLYDLEDRPNSAIKKAEVYIGLKKYKGMIDEYRPDAIVCTHFLPAAVVSHMHQRFPIPNGVVLTDYISHPLWVYPNNHLFFVAHPGMIGELRKLGVDEARIRATGIPVRPVFSQAFDRRALRAKLRLNPDLPVILLMSGGNAVGPLVEIVGALGKIKEEFQVAAIAGRNRRIYHELKRLFRAVHPSGRVLGFVDNVHEWMAVSDLLISKAGGLTVTEALTLGLPMLIIRPTPGQEDGNTRFLTGAGAAIHLKSVAELEGVVERLLKNPEELRTMREKARELARPDASGRILSEMEQLIRQKRREDAFPF